MSGAFDVLRRRWGVLITLALPLLLETFDQTITATAQPHIASSFGRLDLQTWIGTSFILTVTAFLPLFANIADVFGRFWALFWSLIIFLLGSCICTGAQSMPVLLLGRGISGVGGAGITTLTRVIIADVRSLDDNATQSTILVTLQGFGYILGPLIGGGLTKISWRSIFALNIPISILSIFLLWALLRHKLVGPRVPDHQRHNSSPPSASQPPDLSLTQKLGRVDWLGATILISASILVLFGLSTASTSLSSSNWSSPSVVGSLVTGGVATVAFPACEWLLITQITPREGSSRQPQPSAIRSLQNQWTKYTAGVEPMIPLVLFKKADVWASYFTGLTGGMMLFSCLYFLSTYFVIVRGYDAVKSALQLLVVAPGLGLGSYVGIFMIKIWRQPRYPLIVGAALMPLAAGLLGIAVRHDNHSAVDGLLVLAGFSIGITLGSLSLQAQYSHPPRFAAVLVTLSLFFRNLGGTVGLAQLSAVLETTIRSYIRNLVTSGQLTSDDAYAIYASLNTLSTSSTSGSSVGTLQPALQKVVVDAYRAGTRDAFLSLVPWCGVGFLLCWFLGDIQEPSTASTGEVSTNDIRLEPIEAGNNTPHVEEHRA
ncbi:MFS general substrate transporter [Clavulina sp. PMI_390]|nr:MFS general substrate transporter [Clavulina sp. PMI_390]